MLIEEPEATNDVIRNLDYVKVKIGDSNISLSDLPDNEIRNVLSHCTDDQLVQVINELTVSFETVVNVVTNDIVDSDNGEYQTQFIYAVVLASMLKQFGNMLNISLPDNFYNFEEEPQEETEETTDEIESNVP